MLRLSDHQASFSRDLSRLVEWVDRQPGAQRVRILEVKRTLEQQRWYFEAGITSTMRSSHLDSLAADLALDIGGQYQTSTRDYAHLGFYWESLSRFNRWGGRYSDGNHFERLRHPRREEDLTVGRWA